MCYTIIDDGCVTARVAQAQCKKIELGTLVGFIRMLLVISSIFSTEFSVLGISLTLKLPHNKYIQWRMQDENQGGAKTIEMLICMKI
jgi:hypothetical protein